MHRRKMNKIASINCRMQSPHRGVNASCHAMAHGLAVSVCVILGYQITLTLIC